VKEGQEFEMWAGESKEITCTVTDADTDASVNLTGASARWMLQKDELGGTTMLTKDADWAGASGITISGCTFAFTLTHTDTDALQGTFYHEAEIVDSSGCTFKPMRGYIMINQGAI
jgi:hypothetical protein